MITPRNFSSALVSERTAVFYPEDFDPSQSLPSVALAQEPVAQGPVPTDWVIRPHFGATDAGHAVTVEVAPSTDLYGTGEVTGPLRRNGTVTELWNTDNPGYRRAGGRRLYQSQPWVLGVQEDGSAFGILHDCTWRQEIILGRTVRFENDGPACRVFVIQAESPTQVLRELAQLTGTIEMPPRWALGYHQCRWSYYPETRVRQVASEFRKRRLPLDVMWLDIHYMDEYRVFTFDQGRFPAPGELIDDLHQNDIKSVWMIDPGVKKEEGFPVYDSGTADDVWVKDVDGKPAQGEGWPGQVVFPDFTTETARAWWVDQYKGFLAHGVDGVWNDMNEPAVFDSESFTLEEDAVHAGGLVVGESSLPAGPHARYHNVYGLLMAKGTHEAFKAINPDKRPFVLTRASFLGGHRYAATWTGDNTASEEHLKMSVPMSLNLSLSGQPFSGPDIGGFEEDATPELFASWMAIGALFPFARGHTIEGSADHEPWSFGQAVEDSVRRSLQRRYALLPHLYTLFHRAHSVGDPVMAPLFVLEPSNQALRTVGDQFALGSNVIVTPSWSTSSVLPAGRWEPFDVVSQLEPDPYDPVLYLKAGSAVVSCKPTVSTASSSVSELIIHAVLDDDGMARGEFYWDAGEGLGYRADEWSRLRFVIRLKDDEITVDVTREGAFDPKVREVVVRVWSAGASLDRRFVVERDPYTWEPARRG